jgi:glycosyltransferase involved in cell wall biosynthesis
MRVVEVITSLDVGGAERALSQRLHFEPNEVSTLVLHGPSSTKSQVELPSLVKSKQIKLSRKELQKGISDSQPDVVLVHNPANVIRIATIRKGKTPCRQIYVSHARILSESLWKKLAISTFFNLSLTRFDGCIAVSNDARRPIRIPIDMVTCPLGSELADDRPRGLMDRDWPTASRIKFLVLSRLSKPKNLGLLIRAIKALQPEFEVHQAQVLIVGDGPEMNRLRKIARRGKIEHLVQFVGPVEDPTPFLRRADYIVISSRSEGGPLTAYEAILAGAKIVSTPVGVVPDLRQRFPERVLMASGRGLPQFVQVLQQAIDEGPVNDEKRRENIVNSHELKTSTRASEFYSLLTNLGEKRSSAS